MNYKERLRHKLAAVGAKHNNRILHASEERFIIDSTARQAQTHLRLGLAKPPSQALLADLAHLQPLRPTIELWAGDVNEVRVVIVSAHRASQ